MVRFLGSGPVVVVGPTPLGRRLLSLSSSAELLLLLLLLIIIVIIISVISIIKASQ